MTKNDFKGFKSISWYTQDPVGNIYGCMSEAEACDHAKLFAKNGMILCKSTTIVEVVKP